MSLKLNLAAEWLETNGLGGFASGTVSGRRSRRYHALLLAAVSPPTQRFVLVNGFEAWVETNSGTWAISSQYYSPDVAHPNGDEYLATFAPEPWPQWTFRLPHGVLVEFELFTPYETAAVALRWRLLASDGPVTLRVRPLLSGRDYHSLHHENSGFRCEPETVGDKTIWRPYVGVPAVCSQSNGAYIQSPQWYRNFLYIDERSRGLDDTEDLASPGFLQWDLSQGDAVWLLSAVDSPGELVDSNRSALELFQSLHDSESTRRASFACPLHRAADMYIVQRGTGRTIIAGYPWFTDWGRDTFIALRGLCIASNRLTDAQQILTDWAGLVSEGMLPNVFPDHGLNPEYNSVDASLWYTIAVCDFLQAAEKFNHRVPVSIRKNLESAVDAILAGYAKGTRYGIHADTDGLLAAGVSGVQLTWMDAKVGDWVVTARIGKPVEVQALWFNALTFGGSFSPKWKRLAERARHSFEARFWDESRGYLHDVVDVDHQPGRVDSSFRPNQVFAIGGLPLPLLRGDRARAILDAVQARLWTPLGLRSLAPDAEAYAGHYYGGVWQRDGSYHQGTVWPWLIGPLVEAYLRIHGNSPQAMRAAREQFLHPLVDHLSDAGLGHISEIADGDQPHAPQGCPFQAWSLGEFLRVKALLSNSKSEQPKTPDVTERLIHA